jgi:cell wall-associated NlpC family hydrolase
MIKMSPIIVLVFSVNIIIALTGCAGNAGNKDPVHGKLPGDTATIAATIDDTSNLLPGKIPPAATGKEIAITHVHPDSLVAFAKTLVGIPYLYASTDPLKGFDCSGFITYVFSHFNMTVPRSSVDFTNYGEEIGIEKAKPGDLILFTGTDSTIRIVGHMGIVESAGADTLRFIHSTSGNAKGVVITPFGDYYKKRFVKVIRVFPGEYF